MSAISLLLSIYLGSSIFTAGLFAFDKSYAERKLRRISEKNLILASALCGWPGALFAMKVFRHKTQKASFKIMLGVAIMVNLFLVIYLNNLGYSNV